MRYINADNRRWNMIWRHRRWGKNQMGPGPGYLSSTEPLDRDQAKELFDYCIISSGNPDIRIGEVKETGDYFEAEIVTPDGSVKDVLQVNKKTGWVKSGC
jgi:hypothetical protein